MLERRGFLRNLVSLPLLGGSVALVGRPTRAAVPATNLQLAQYAAFCFDESLACTTLLRERGISAALLNTPYPHELEAIRGTSPVFRAPLLLSAAGVRIGGAA